MATRKYGNIHFPKYFKAVRPSFTRIFFQELFGLEGSKHEPSNDWGERGCNKFVPVLGRDGTKMAPPGHLFAQLPCEIR